MEQAANSSLVAFNGKPKTTPTVMVVGKSGMGKSTLCNYLLYGKPRPTNGFRVAPGSDPVTFACQTVEVSSTPAPKRLAPLSFSPTSGPLRTIDTPGIPDPDGRTLDFYDDIVHTTRQAGVMNAVIIAVNYTGDRDQIKQEFDSYGLLIKQFAKITCYKIMVCRYRVPPDLEEDEEAAEMEAVNKWVQELKGRAGIQETPVALLKEDNSMSTQIFKLRELLCNMPQTTTMNSNMQTYRELQVSVKALTDKEGHRVEELQKKASELCTEKELLRSQNAGLEVTVEKIRKRGNYISALIVGGGMVIDACTGLVTFGSVTAGSLAAGAAAKSASKAHACSFKTQIKMNDKRVQEIDTNVTDINLEVESGNPNEEALASDQAELRQLENIARKEDNAGARAGRGKSFHL